MEFNLISKQTIKFPYVRSLKRKKRVVAATKTHKGRYYPSLDPVIDRKPEATIKEKNEATGIDQFVAESTDEDDDDASAADNAKLKKYENSRVREKSIDFLFGGDSDLAKELKIQSEVLFTTELTLTSSNGGRLKIYTKLENPQDKERGLFEGLFKLQESLPPNSFGLILSVKDFENMDSDDNSESYDYDDTLSFIEKGLRFKRNEAGSVILEMTDMHFPEDGIWWVKWIHRRAEFYGGLSLNVRLDLAAVTELYKRQFKGGPLATEVMTATDMVILVEGNKDKEKGIKCHKSVLSGMSPVFSAMFQADMLEAKEGTLEITDFSEAVIRAIIEFAYRGNLEEALKSFEIALELLKAADKYQMKGLMDVLLHIISCMPCAGFEVDLAIKLCVFVQNRGRDLEQAEKKGGIVLKWYAKKYPEKMKDSKVWADMCENPHVAMEFIVQLLNKMK